jgi:hypothetical protein
LSRLKYLLHDLPRKIIWEFTGKMKGFGWKQILSITPLIGAIAALIAAVLGQEGIWGLTTRISGKENPGSNVSSESSIMFSCQNIGGSLSTVVSSSNRQEPAAIIKWDLENQYFGEEWPPEKRCETVSQRFQSIYDRDQLAYITADTADWESSLGIPIICSILEEGERCAESDLLFTLEDGDDPNKILAELIAIREAPKDNKALLRSGADSFREGVRVYYDIREYIGSSDSKNNEPLF